MNIEQLHLFIEVANLKSMRLASEKLFVTPQYISKSIQNLEKQLNVKLFHRNRYGVELTKEGEIIYPFVQDVYNRFIHLYEVIPQALANSGEYHKENPPIRLNIGASGNYSASFIDVLNMLSSKYPNIIPNIVARESNDLLLSLDENAYDMILCNADKKFIDLFDNICSNYSIYPIFQSELYLFVDKFSPLALKKSIKAKELSSLPLSFVCSGNEITPLFLQILQEKNIEPHISFTSSSPQCCTSYSTTSNTYSIGAANRKRESQKRGENIVAIPIDDLEPIWQVLLVNHDFSAPQLAQDIVNILTSIFQKSK